MLKALTLKFVLTAFVVMPLTPQTLFAAGKKTEARACLDCYTGKTTSPDELERFIVNMKNFTNNTLYIKLIADKMGYAKKCDNFVGEGKVNPWAKVLKSELSKKRYKKLLDNGSRDIVRYCPNYHNMKTEDKKSLYVLVMVGKAFFESSCDPKKKTQGPNGIAKGLVQLHAGHEDEYNPRDCRIGDANNPKRSLICGLSLVHKQVIRNGQNLFSDASHFEVLMPNPKSKAAKKVQAAKKIMKSLSMFPPCQTSGRAKAQASNFLIRKSTVRVAKK